MARKENSLFLLGIYVNDNISQQNGTASDLLSNYKYGG